MVGWDRLPTVVGEIHGEAGFNPFSGEGFGPAYIVWMIFAAGIVSCAVWQTSVMRACAAADVGVVRRLYMWSSVGFLVRFLVPQFLGICALVYFWERPEARDFFFTSAGEVVGDAERTMQAFPAFLSQILPAGIIGIVAAGLLAAFMSTHDSYLLCWASVLAQDVCAPLAPRGLSVRTRLILARTFVLAIGVFLLVWGLWYPLGQDLWDYMAVTGAVYSTGAFALLFLGLYWKRASATGAYLALCAGAFAFLGLGSVRSGLAAAGLEPVLELVGLAGEGLTNEVISARVCLGALTGAMALMLVGSLLFPQGEVEPEAVIRRGKAHLE
jgi:SSS family solute:Na+ symporter